MNTSLGLSMSPTSGRNSEQVGQNPHQECREQRGPSGLIAEFEEGHDAAAVGAEPDEVGRFDLRFTEEVSPPSCSRLVSARRITPAVCVDTPPIALSSGLPSSLVG